jgi:hypothetical protein
VFVKHKMDDPYKKGYDDWMQNDDNVQIETVKQQEEILKYQEPSPLLQSSLENAYELGKEIIEDFSGDNMSNNTLNYMDYKKAHSTHRLIDPLAVIGKKEYKCVDDLVEDRSHIRFNMSETERYEYEKHLQRQKEKEDDRQRNIKLRDSMIEQNHQKIRNLLR